MPLALQAVGLRLLGLAPNLPIAFIGVATFGIGPGPHTLSHPWVIPQLFGVAATGRVNGAIACGQRVARAAGVTPSSTWSEAIWRWQSSLPVARNWFAGLVCHIEPNPRTSVVSAHALTTIEKLSYTLRSNIEMPYGSPNRLS